MTWRLPLSLTLVKRLTPADTLHQWHVTSVVCISVHWSLHTHCCLTIQNWLCSLICLNKEPFIVFMAVIKSVTYTVYWLCSRKCTFWILFLLWIKYTFILSQTRRGQTQGPGARSCPRECFHVACGFSIQINYSFNTIRVKHIFVTHSFFVPTKHISYHL